MSATNANTNTSEETRLRGEMEQEVNQYVGKRKAAKKNMMDKMNKQEMVDIIFKQNDMISQQSSQMLDIIDMANVIEKTARADELEKCNIVKMQNESCGKISSLQKQHMNTYENSIRIQIVLFLLFLVMMIWLLYNYVFASSTIYESPSTSTTSTTTSTSTSP